MLVLYSFFFFEKIKLILKLIEENPYLIFFVQPYNVIILFFLMKLISNLKLMDQVMLWMKLISNLNLLDQIMVWMKLISNFKLLNQVMVSLNYFVYFKTCFFFLNFLYLFNPGNQGDRQEAIALIGTYYVYLKF